MLGIGLSRATGGSRTTGMVFLLKGIYPRGVDRFGELYVWLSF